MVPACLPPGPSCEGGISIRATDGIIFILAKCLSPQSRIEAKCRLHRRGQWVRCPDQDLVSGRWCFVGEGHHRTTKTGAVGFEVIDQGWSGKGGAREQTSIDLNLRDAAPMHLRGALSPLTPAHDGASPARLDHPLQVAWVCAQVLGIIDRTAHEQPTAAVRVDHCCIAAGA